MTIDINQIQIPEDAGEFAPDLAAILQRIPDGWGRWISHGKGWYPLIIQLDMIITSLVPSYEIHQVKEKFGTLCFYWGVPASTPSSLFNAIDFVVSATEHESARTCENCGSKEGRLCSRGGSWVKTLCADCGDDEWKEVVS